MQRAAFSRGLLAYDRPIDSHDLDLTLDGVGIKKAILLTDDENFASHAAHHLTEHLGRANLYQVQPDEDDDDFEMRGRRAFGELAFRQLTTLARGGGFVTAAVDELPEGAVPLFRLPGDHTALMIDGAAPSDGNVIAAIREPVVDRRSQPAD